MAGTEAEVTLSYLDTWNATINGIRALGVADECTNAYQYIDPKDKDGTTVRILEGQSDTRQRTTSLESPSCPLSDQSPTQGHIVSKDTGTSGPVKLLLSFHFISCFIEEQPYHHHFARGRTADHDNEQ